MGGQTSRIPLMRPRLPDAEALLPYLRQIDEARWYTNFGPLLRVFEQRLIDILAPGEGEIVCVANGTLGLVLALRARDPAPGALCVMPSWTFEATPAAACMARLVPCFLDVDAETWALDPRTVESWLPEAPGPVAAVVPVSPFGAPVDTAAWDSFAGRTGIPVVIDAAAGFDAMTIGRSPTVISLHATKAFGIGEGGLVASTDRKTITRIRHLSNFGFAKGRQLVGAGVNAKMSEYGAAVGLAALDSWPAKQRSYLRLAETYVELFRATPRIRTAPGFGGGRVQPTCNIDLGRPIAEAVIDELRNSGIEARRWWGRGCHRHGPFADYPRVPLPVTERLGDSVVGLPFFPSLTTVQVRRVHDAVKAAQSANVES
jgi:dTDP-4-amino-4,6-dideoxygalactose transaminase